MSSEMDKKLRDLEVLLGISQELIAATDLGVLLQRIVSAATNLVDADRSSLFILREDGCLETRVAEQSVPIVLPKDSGIAGLVARTGEIVSIPDAYADPRFKHDIDARTGYRTRSVLCVPLRGRTGQTVGVLEAMNKKGDLPFSRGDGELLRVLCCHAAVAIETKRLLDGELRRTQMQNEMDVARKIHQGLLPRPLPVLAGLRFEAWQETADETGGDYYDVIQAPQGSADLLVCDVAGHGIASALLMSAARAYLRALHTVESNPERLMQKLNTLLVPDMPQDSFVTMALCRVEPDGAACYVSAGHLPPLIYRPGRKAFDQLDGTDLILGYGPDTLFLAHPIDPLRSGDIVVLLTDGLYEAPSPGGRLWGLDSVKRVIADSAKFGVETVARALKNGLDQHLGNNRNPDDATVLAAGRL